jgi:EmrB/QacA subfamily drug resistance transporter
LGEHRNKNLVLAAMIFAVSMTFIDQTIVAIAIPELQQDLELSETGIQWVINAYLIALSALFAFGGKLADVLGHRRMVTAGVITFAGASAVCGFTPTGSISEAWIIVFRVIQGAGAALMMPAALAIVISSFPLGERGKAMATFFGITGALTAIGPLAGGYLSEITWRSIFWVNVPVAIIALILIARSRPPDERFPQKIDFRSVVLISAGMGLAVLGLQQSSQWGWDSALTWASILVGVALIVTFVFVSLRAENPLIQVRIFANRAFAADNAILFLLMIVFIPVFFFASTYAQIALGESASTSGLYLLTFFGGFGTASQLSGRILDERGPRPAVVLGCLVAAAGLFLWARQVPDLNFNNQWYWIVLAGAGCGLVLGPANTDAVNRAARSSYGEVTGITQTVRNFGASIGLAVLGTLLISQNRGNIESSLGEFGIPREKADEIAASLSQAGGGDSSGFAEHAGQRAQEIFGAVQLDYALATRSVLYAMAGVMVVAFLVALVSVPSGKVEEVPPSEGHPPPQPQPGA